MEKYPPYFLDKEFQFLLSVCGGLLNIETASLKNTDPGLLDWNRCIHLAGQHKILPTIYKGIKTLSIQMPDEPYQLLKTKYEKLVQKSMLYTRELALVTTMFKERDIPYLALKGPYLAQQLYNDFVSRQFSDLDIVIGPDNFDRAVELLESSGYRRNFDYKQLNDVQRKYYFSYFTDLTFKHIESGIIIELHWKIVSSGTLVKETEKMFWKNFHTEFITDRPIKGLSLADHLLYMTIHGYKHGWYRLSWLWDVASAFRKLEEIELDQFYQTAQRNNIEIPVNQAAFLCNEFFGTDFPRNKLKPLASGIGKFAIDSVIRGTPDYSFAGIFKNLLYQCRMKKSYRYWKSILGSYLTHYRDWHAIPLTGILFPLYFILHPFLFLIRKLKKSHNKKRATV